MPNFSQDVVNINEDADNAKDTFSRRLELITMSLKGTEDGRSRERIQDFAG